MADAAKQISYVDSDVPALVVFGQNGTEPPRGSWFASEDINAATAGAELMGLAVLEVNGPELNMLASRMPKGRVFESSGKLFMPRIQKEVYAQLQGHLPEEDSKPQLELVASGEEKSEASSDSGGESKSEDNSISNATKGTLPTEWSKIGVGSLVLTRDIEEDDEAFYLAVILGKAGPTSFRLKWRDYPDIDPITREIRQLAMLHPKTDMSEIEWDWEE